ncbi:MAG TPA: hypothetical protein VF230_14730 [Acidimicrobiales bacterium]
MTLLDLRPHDGAIRGLGQDFAHAVGIDQAVRGALELPPVPRLHAFDIGDAATSEIEVIKARLAARGLLATRPQIMVPKAPRAGADAAPTEVDAHRRDGAGSDGHWAESALDRWDVEPGRTETTVRCPQCREVFFRPVDATRFACPTCDRSWRWAVCGGCDELVTAIERQESWRCGRCSHLNRSWWRTPTAQRDAMHVVTRRKHHLAEAERRAVREGMRKRRWKLVALGVAAVVTAAAVVVGVRLAEPADTGTGPACAHWMQLRPDITNGTLVGEPLDLALDELVAKAAGASAAIERAATTIAAAPVGSTAFLGARTDLSDACEAAR